MHKINCIIVIGLGSMGKRRARLLRRNFPAIKVIGVDTSAERRQEFATEFNLTAYASIKEALKDKPQAAIISTSPLSHAAIVKECLEHNLHVFTELNLTAAGYEENMKLAERKGKTLFLSSTFLYRKEIQYIKEQVEKQTGKLSYMYHAGQYLPDWHPWENYKDFFVGDKRTNGCREFMAIEFPWLLDTFGDIKELQTHSCNHSNLHIDFPDTYQIYLEHETGHRGMMTIDVVSRKAVRNFELFGEDLYITWDGTPQGLKLYDYERKETQNVATYEEVEQREGYSSFVIENVYLEEVINFLDVINGEAQAKYSFAKDKHILAWLDKIEGSE